MINFILLPVLLSSFLSFLQFGWLSGQLKNDSAIIWNVKKMLKKLQFYKRLLINISFSFLLTLGPALPKGIYRHSMVEVQGDAFLFGGIYSGGSNSAIYRLSCSSGTCSWSKLNQELKVARESTVAIPVPDYFCEGKEGMLDHWLVKCNQKLLRLFMHYF